LTYCCNNSTCNWIHLQGGVSSIFPSVCFVTTYGILCTDLLVSLS